VITNEAPAAKVVNAHASQGMERASSGRAASTVSEKPARRKELPDEVLDAIAAAAKAVKRRSDSQRGPREEQWRDDVEDFEDDIRSALESVLSAYTP
jgi:hypothetical protein